MVYSGPFINAIFSSNDNDIDTTTNLQNANPSVDVLYNSTSIASITGPVPLVTLSHQFNRADNGVLNSITHRINLNGRIYDRDASSTSLEDLLSKEKQLKDLFKDCPIGGFEIKCGGAVVLSATGVKAVSMTTDPTPDNLTRSLAYNIDLEYYEKQSSSSYMVTSVSDAWTIEPLEEYAYENFTVPISARSESDNPNQGSASTSSLNIINLPQFRVSHRVSAKGAMPDDDCTNEDAYFKAYREAQKWVKDRLDSPWLTDNSKGPFVGAYNLPPNNNLWLFNHVRSINFSVSDATYEIVDTWLAMPSGVKHTEDYTIEVSGDEKNNKTVRVQGTIKGLAAAPTSLVQGDTSLIPDTAGKIDLSNSLTSNQSGGSVQVDPNTALTSQVSAQKYNNARDVWHSGIKPILYRRASSGLNRIVYTNNLDPKTYNLENPPEQTIYRADRQLNINPVSMTESHDHKRGVITYSYEFNNKYSSLIEGVLSENVTVTDTGPADVVAEIFVIGRSLGPILQSLGTKTASRKEVSIEVEVVPPTSIAQYHMNSSDCPLYFRGSIYNKIEALVEGLKPFGFNDPSVVPNAGPTQGQVYVERNTHSWNPTDGRYTRNVSWIYQHCNNGNFYLDH
jgi:hypothetical protein